ncbi:hypothetical protein G6F46_013489 [Rhizopus delemar]|nr:hypothetical protein G6F46_013489 [Rhizopus delemar]
MRYNKAYFTQSVIAQLTVKDKITKHWDSFGSYCTGALAAPHLFLTYPHSAFLEQLTLKYGIESIEAQANASRELLTISMQPDETVEKYTDRFLKLKREATPVADDFLAILFVNSLPGSLRNHVNMALVSLNQEAKNDINLLASIARKFHTKQQILPNMSTRKFNNQPSQANGLNPPSGIHKRNHRTDGRTVV